jgi:hypothetical protein
MRRIVTIAVGILLLVGCGPKNPRGGVLSGKITYKGQPVNDAAIVLYPPNQTNQYDPMGGQILVPVTHEGEFLLKDVPPGDYKVVVQGSEGSSEASLKDVPPEKRAEAKEKLDKMVRPKTIPFPDKYKLLQKTDLHVTIKSGEQKLDLELKD